MELFSVQQQWLSQLQSPTDPSTIASLLAADLHTIGAPCLPQNIAELDVLQGCFVLQADEVVNIAAPARDRCVGGGWRWGVTGQPHAVLTSYPGTAMEDPHEMGLGHSNCSSQTVCVLLRSLP